MTILYPLQCLQNKLLKIISKNTFIIDNFLLRLEEVFILESLSSYYEGHKNKFIESNSKTRTKNKQLPRFDKTLTKRTGKIVAIKHFNLLPNESKVLGNNKRIIKGKPRDWIKKTHETV